MPQTHQFDRIIHEPARLVILAALNKVEEADFKFLCAVTGLTKGNLSRQSAQLEEAGYIEIHKYYKGRVPATSYRMTEQGRKAFANYWEQMSALRPDTQQQRMCPCVVRKGDSMKCISYSIAIQERLVNDRSNRAYKKIW